MDQLNLFIQSNLFLFLTGIFIFIVLLLIGNIVVFLKFKTINKRSKQFFAGKKGKDLEKVINEQKKQIKKLQSETTELFDASEKIYHLAFRGLHKVGIIRFNPFNDVGGNQSFVVAMLNGDDSGTVISSLFTRSGTRFYAKQITNGICKKHTLTEEEKQAIQIAKNFN